MIKKPGNVSITELFTYDVVSQPGFVVSSIRTLKKETREQIRKNKIIKILKKPTRLSGFFYFKSLDLLHYKRSLTLYWLLDMGHSLMLVFYPQNILYFQLLLELVF